MRGLAAKQRDEEGRAGGLLSIFVLLRWTWLHATLRFCRGGRRAAITAAAIGLVALPAAGAEWAATVINGTVLTLVGEKWQEVERGPLTSPYSAIRTLQSGRLEIQSDATRIVVGRNTTFELLQDEDGLSVRLRQYSGRITLELGAAPSETVTLQALNSLVVARAGSVSVALAGESVEIVVGVGGDAMVTDSDSGQVVSMTGGQVASLNGADGLEIVGTAEGAVVGASAGDGASDDLASNQGTNSNGSNANANGANANGANGNGADGNGSNGNGANGANSANANENANSNAGSENSNSGGNGEGKGADHKGGKDG